MTTAILTPGATATPGTSGTPVTSGTPAARQSLVTRSLLLRFATIIGASVSFYLPLSVMPLFAKSSGAGTGAGMVTGALLLTTVAVELVTPRLLARAGYRRSLTAGLLMLGAPALALLVSSNPAVVIGVSIVRGAGFAVTTVAGGALTAALIPPERRGEGLGLVGIVGGVPALVALPGGVWIAAHWGFRPVFAATRRRGAAGPRRAAGPAGPAWTGWRRARRAVQAWGAGSAPASHHLLRVNDGGRRAGDVPAAGDRGAVRRGGHDRAVRPGRGSHPGALGGREDRRPARAHPCCSVPG